MSTLHVTTTSYNAEVADSKQLVLVDFWASWCGPCRMIAPVIDELATEYEGKVKIAKVNVDEEPDLARQFGVMSIPTIMVFKDGKVVAKTMGVQPKERLKQMIQGAL